MWRRCVALFTQSVVWSVWSGNVCQPHSLMCKSKYSLRFVLTRREASKCLVCVCWLVVVSRCFRVHTAPKPTPPARQTTAYNNKKLTLHSESRAGVELLFENPRVRVRSPKLNSKTWRVAYNVRNLILCGIQYCGIV